METNRKTTYILLTIATIFWGIQPLCIKWLVAEWTPVTITSGRYFLISGILFFILYLRQDRGILPPRHCFLPLVFMGVTGITVNNVAQFTGLQYSTVTNCTLIAAASPAFTAFLSAIFIKERLNRLQWSGIAISFAGALCVVSQGSLAVIRNISFNTGDMLFFVCQINWTIYSIIGRRVMGDISALATTAWAGLFGAIITACYGIYAGQLTFTVLEAVTFSAFLYTVFLGGVLAMLFWNIGVKQAGPSLTAIFQNVTPVVGVAAGAFFLQEAVDIQEIGGALAIFVGVYFTTHSEQVGRLLLRSERTICTGTSAGHK
ncbi:putative membrane protein [Propionispora sp. 2/2-37]|nr:putative membrane protein [Propionispora sp. 2/2-37]